jgi:uncharacterized tellurite resistance protein B-like protein
MNMETPRTDKAVKESNGQWSYALVDTCKQLERELAEAREQRDALINILTDVINEDGTAKSIDRASIFLTAVKGASHEK